MSQANITTKFSLPAWLRKANPFSMGAGQPEYVPQWFVNMFKSKGAGSSKFNNSGTPQKLAHIADKTLHGIAFLAAATWLTRSFMHKAKIDNIDDMNPSATASGKLQPDNIQTDPVISKKAGLDPYATGIATIPTAAAALAVLAAFVKADKHFDQKLGQELDSKIQQQESKGQDIARRRILKARGVIPGDGMTKTQAFGIPQNLQGALALLALSLSVGGFMAGHSWQRDNSKNYIKYKAYKKGLQSLLDSKNQQSAVHSSPLDASFVSQADSALSSNKKPVNNTQVTKQLDLI